MKEDDAMLESLRLHQCDQQLQLTKERRGPPLVSVAMTECLCVPLVTDRRLIFISFFTSNHIDTAAITFCQIRAAAV